MAMASKWIDLQLHPEKIPDAAAESRVAGFRTLHEFEGDCRGVS